jgi:hypothetical protein
MVKSNLEANIKEAADQFALVVVNAVKSATLQELIALQSEAVSASRAKAGRRLRKKPGPKPGRKPGHKAAVKSALKPAKKKRIVKNYPKCAYPGCNKNRFPRGKGYCGDHWRAWTAGKIKAASAYKK